MYSYKILNFQESTTILNAYTKKSGNLLNAPRTYQVIFVGERDYAWISMKKIIGIKGIMSTANAVTQTQAIHFIEQN